MGRRIKGFFSHLWAALGSLLFIAMIIAFFVIIFALENTRFVIHCN